MEMSTTLLVTSREEWRAWLEANHDREREVWLIYYKRHTGRPRIPYDDAVEEALCFGWIDSLIQTIDDERYAQKFTPRSLKSKWSALNRGRVADLARKGMMTEAGMSKITFPLPKGGRGAAPKPKKRIGAIPVPAFMEEALKANEPAWTHFQALAPSYRKLYVRWVTEAKREDTRRRRLKEAMACLKRNERLPMK